MIVAGPGIQWWCSAKGTPWTWEWQAYPGVWLFVAAIGAAFWRLVRRAPGAPPRPTWRNASLLLAVLLLWATLDWPIGPLGAGYLAWIHAAQFVSLAMVIPPLLLAGLGADGAARILARPAGRVLVGAATEPLSAAIGFALVMVVSHIPAVVDTLMRSQGGAFLLDAGWFVSGVAFWWPIMLPDPPRRRFAPLLQMVYIFLGTQPHIYVAMWLLLGAFPKYATYELAPRMSALSALQDQAFAGALLLGLTLPIVFGVVLVIFMRWVREEGA